MAPPDASSASGVNIFDVRENDERRHAAVAYGSAMSWIGVGAFIIAGVVVPLIGVYRGEWPLAILGVVVLAVGIVMLRGVRSASARRLVAVDVSPQGLTIHFSDSSTRNWIWNDPSLRLRLVDYSAASRPAPAGFRGFAGIPCAIIVGNGPAGISLAALKAIRLSAKSAGLAVVDGTPDEMSRSIYIGKWPNVPRPFTVDNPYM